MRNKYYSLSNIYSLLSFLTILLTSIFSAISFLGDVDTVCNVAGLDSEQCGSYAIISFLADPPLWLFSLTILLGLIFFALAERQKRGAEIEQALGAHHKMASEAEAKSQQVIETLEAMQKRLDVCEVELTKEKEAVRADLKEAVSQREQSLIDNHRNLSSLQASQKNELQSMLDSLKHEILKDVLEITKSYPQDIEQIHSELSRIEQRFDDEQA